MTVMDRSFLIGWLIDVLSRYFFYKYHHRLFVSRARPDTHVFQQRHILLLIIKQSMYITSISLQLFNYLILRDCIMFVLILTILIIFNIILYVLRRYLKLGHRFYIRPCLGRAPDSSSVRVPIISTKVQSLCIYIAQWNSRVCVAHFITQSSCAGLTLVYETTRSPRGKKPLLLAQINE